VEAGERVGKDGEGMGLSRKGRLKKADREGKDTEFRVGRV